ncbi:MAG: hypothetical protein ACREUT_15905, partial [Steroidobacteraceae bacterium]
MLTVRVGGGSPGGAEEFELLELLDELLELLDELLELLEELLDAELADAPLPEGPDAPGSLDDPPAPHPLRAQADARTSKEIVSRAWRACAGSFPSSRSSRSTAFTRSVVF